MVMADTISMGTLGRQAEYDRRRKKKLASHLLHSIFHLMVLAGMVFCVPSDYSSLRWNLLLLSTPVITVSLKT